MMVFFGFFYFFDFVFFGIFDFGFFGIFLFWFLICVKGRRLLFFKIFCHSSTP